MNFAQMLAYGPRLSAPVITEAPKRQYVKHPVVDGMKPCTKCGDPKPATKVHFRETKLESGRVILRATCRCCEVARHTEQRRRRKEAS